jgi:hypothetical protein
MDFSSFDDYWLPFATGEGPQGQFVVGLTNAARKTLTGKDEARLPRQPA